MSTEQEIMKDIRRRHSTLHDVDKQCTVAMVALTEMITPASEHGLIPELDAVYKSLKALHAAARAKFEAIA